MNKENWADLQEYLPLFSELNLDMSFLYLTETGYTKGIIDATVPVRNFLRKNNLHDYETQGQGQKEHGAELQTKMILHDATIELTTSLYRPQTKKGDPRIWFRGIKKYCDANSFIALATDKKQLYILNLTDETVKKSLSSKGYVYQELLKLSQEKQSIARELYTKIKDIHNKGFIPTVVSGDTGVGMTLEHELGIPPNSQAKPDYKGIELKATRETYTDTRNAEIPLENEKKTGENFNIIPNIRVDFGCNISIGENFYSNYNLSILDEGYINFGNNCYIGPNCSFYTACHPIDFNARNACFEWTKKLMSETMFVLKEM